MVGVINIKGSPLDVSNDRASATQASTNQATVLSSGAPATTPAYDFSVKFDNLGLGHSDSYDSEEYSDDFEDEE